MTKERMLEIIKDSIDVIKGTFFNDEIEGVLLNDLRLTKEELDEIGIKIGE